MYISQALVNEGLDLLNQPEDEILVRLGNELYSWESQQPVQPLSSTISLEELKRKAAEYLENKRQILKRAVCADWKGKKRDDFQDTSQLLVVLVDAIAQALNLTSAYVNVAMVTAVIIMKRNLDKFCNE